MTDSAPRRAWERGRLACQRLLLRCSPFAAGRWGSVRPRAPRPHGDGPSTMGLWALQLGAVLAIMLLLVASAGLALRPREARALDQAEEEILAALERARGLARATGIGHGVLFDPLADRIAVVAEGGSLVRDPRTRAPWTVSLGAASGSPVDVRAVDVGAGSTATFGPDGEMVRPGTVELVRGETTRTLRLGPSPGAARQP